MGQYYKGDKIGTCELMYYITLKEAEQLAKKGQKDDDGIYFADYLKDNTTKWRFPFPCEDNKNGSFDFNNRQPFKPDFLLFADSLVVDVEHTEKCFSCSVDGVYNVNIFVPCPFSKDFDIKTSMGFNKREVILLPKFEAYRQGERKTIFACGYCGELQRFDKGVEHIKAYSSEHYKVYETGNKGLYEYARKVIDRLC